MVRAGQIFTQIGSNFSIRVPLSVVGQSSFKWLVDLWKFSRKVSDGVIHISLATRHILGPAVVR